MQTCDVTVWENCRIAKGVYRLVLTGPELLPQRPGGFVNLSLEGFFLRRPLSVCDSEQGRLTLIYKTVGRGTERLATLEKGTVLNLLAGLGNGYDLAPAGDCPVLLGGGAGVPPLYLLARQLRARGLAVRAVLGFNTAEEVFGEEAFRKLGCEVTVTCVDGTAGCRGFVTDALPAAYTYFYACGPGPMLKAVYQKTVTSGQFSLEERMGCGFGACMGCSVKTASGPKRICREGPVFRKEELLWDD